MGNSSRLEGKVYAQDRGVIHELRIGVGLDYREATSGKYNEVEIGNETSVDTKLLRDDVTSQ